MTDKQHKILFQVAMIIMLFGTLYFIRQSPIKEKIEASILISILIIFPLALIS